MSTFFGELTRWSVDGVRLDFHFAADCFPAGELPALAAVDVAAEALTNQDAVVASLRSMNPQQFRAVEVPLEPDGDDFAITFDEYESPLLLCGGNVTVRESAFDAKDYERLIDRFASYLRKSEDDVTSAHGTIREVERLCRNQLGRLEAKAAHYEVGSTARTLYDQHKAFIRKLIEQCKRRG